ncbi:MAG: glycosyltransferase [Clostridiaceae bacterium]|nr:glycosyltransferase [Clostridiaceae bacterium]
MKKALLVTRVSGFIPQHEMNNVKILQEMGYQVHYATNLNTVVYGKDNSRLDGTGIITHQIDFCRSPLSAEVKKAYRQLCALMEAEQFDLVHCHMPISGVLARLAANRERKRSGRNVPVLYTAHGFHFCKGVPLKNWLYYPVERFMAGYTDRLVTINQEDYIRAQKFPVRGSVVRTNGVGIRLERFAPYQKTGWGIERGSAGNDIREQYGIPKDYRILTSVGELAPGKNNMLAVEALAELRDLKLAYLICGEGQMETALKKRVADLKLEDRVFFAGYVDRTPEILQQSDCFLFPSGREGLPVAVMEAMAVGLPVIASDIRGIRDLIEHTKGGYLVRSFSPEEYAVKIRRLFTEKEGELAIPRELRREQMGRWNMERVKQFSIQIVEKQMREIYRGVEKEECAQK